MLARLGLFIPAVACAVATAAMPAAARADAPAGPSSTPVMIVLDASGSMTTADAPGPRIVAAKKAVTGLIRSLPSDARVGLEVYGTSTGSSNAEKAAGCRDILTLAPVGPVDKTGLTAKVARIKARGYTPIGNALRKAAQALPKEGARSIVLVSDGEDTCAPPDPCDVAKQLKKQGVDLTIQTVGFRVDAKARAQLSCIAAATGGSYHDADDGEALSRELDTGVQRALQPYAVVGTPIVGTPTPDAAPRLQPGQYVDTLDKAATSSSIGNGSTKYYSVVLHRGETPYISATLVPPGTPGNDLGAGAGLTAPDGTSCGSGHSADFNYGGKGVSAQTAVIAPGPVGGPDWPADCPTEGRFTVKVIRQTDGYPRTPLKVELAFRIEPPADASGLPGPAHAQKPAKVGASTGTTRSASAGDSFNNAALLTPGRYRDTIVLGETRYYRVHLDWGQRLVYQVAAQKVSGIRSSSLGVLACKTRLANPLRAPVRQSDSPGSVSFTFTEGCGLDRKTFGGSTLAPVRYTNRNAEDKELQPYSLDGDYFLSLQADFPDSGKPLLTIPYTLTVQVIGKPERGPVYQPLAATSPSTPATAAPSTTSPPSTSATAAPSIGTRLAASDDGSNAGWIALVGGFGALILIGGGALWWRRRSAAHQP